MVGSDRGENRVSALFFYITAQTAIFNNKIHTHLKMGDTNRKALY